MRGGTRPDPTLRRSPALWRFMAVYFDRYLRRHLNALRVSTWGLPATSGLVEMVNGVERRLPNDKFFVPGSVLSMDVDTASPLAYGFDPKVDVMWENSPALRLGPDAPVKGVRTVGWFGTDKPLRSGWPPPGSAPAVPNLRPCTVRGCSIGWTACFCGP